ncbi:aromatic acid exporter family protein [Streptomyces sp. NRRL F-2664]|uniref:aromatic acid exporter family protein n=1 Tax=Streptomyces sp. NRRL F-2664 TaxID=1463842 RepID=UPI0004CABEDC|nr:aromatic acid exporter family protein [Streptomyces sp. NRRL F-2664]
MGTSAAAAARDAVGFVRRGIRSSGNERDDLVLVVKTVVAATVAWVLARYLLPPTVSTFAPFTALVALQSTVYRSLRECAQYLAAMTAGAALAASFAALTGIHGWSFALLTLVALGVGRFRPLGEHGTQVAIIGFFAYSSGLGQIDYIGHLVASVAIGAGCGVVAHAVLAPARHTVHRKEAVADLFRRVESRIGELADAFETEAPDAERVHRLGGEWRALSFEADRIRQAVDAEVENSRLNPRPTIEGSADALVRAREALDVCQRCQDHLRSAGRSLDHAVAGGELAVLPASFRSAYAGVLRTAARAIHHIGRPERTDPQLLSQTLDQAGRALDHARRTLLVADGRPETAALQGTLLTDAGRLLEELHHSDRFLAQST